MAATQDPDDSLGSRLTRWAQGSIELRDTWKSMMGVPKTPEEAAIRGYQRSTTGDQALPHPGLSERQYDVLSQRHGRLGRRLAWMLLLLAPLLVTAGILLDPVVAKAVLWGLLLPLAALVVHDGRALAAVERKRHLTLRGGLADAWQDWINARDQLDELDGASQARAALAANEARMQSLLQMLGEAEGKEDHQDTEEHAASREWVFRTTAKAVALATAERELEAATQRHVEAGSLRLAPDGDTDALDQALDAARELTDGVDDLPQ